MFKVAAIEPKTIKKDKTRNNIVSNGNHVWLNVKQTFTDEASI